MTGGIPVVIVEGGGVPIRQVPARAPVMTVAANGSGLPITLSDRGAPFIIQGSDAQDSLLVLSTDEGDALADDDNELMETY